MLELRHRARGLILLSGATTTVVLFVRCGRSSEPAQRRDGTSRRRHARRQRPEVRRVEDPAGAARLEELHASQGDAAEAVAEVKPETDGDLVVLGSGELVQSLMRRNLVDEYVLLIHPLVLGPGRRLFTDGGAFAALRLVGTKTTTTGVVIATYAVTR